MLCAHININKNIDKRVFTFTHLHWGTTENEAYEMLFM